MDDGIGKTDEQPVKRKSRGNLFIVDVPTYAAVCALGDADVAAVYLILAAGTGADNRTSTWSREAINKRTGLNWRKADACIAKLEAKGLLRWLSGKSTRRPRIDLSPVDKRPPMQKHVAALAERIAQRHQPTTPTEKATATVGQRDGWLAQDKHGIWKFTAQRPLVKAYLPNILVGDNTGKATGLSTVIDRIRLARDPMAFRLLIDLYGVQNLAEHGGVDRQHFRKKVERESVYATGTFQLWKFSGPSPWISWTPELRHHRREPTPTEKEAGYNAGIDLFERINVLQDAGALEWVYYLAEDEELDSTLIYPVGVERHGKMVSTELESIVGSYATRAAFALYGQPEQAAAWEACMPGQMVLPADRLAKRATIVGVPRLRWRAQTTNAARWRSELVDNANTSITMFRGIIAEKAPELLAEADHRLADFNVLSMKSSTIVQRDINDPSRSTMHTVSDANASSPQQAGAAEEKPTAEKPPINGKIPAVFRTSHGDDDKAVGERW